jgi:plastocyanin
MPTTTPATSIPPTSTSTQSVTVNLSAKGFAFDKSSITVPAGADVTLVFTNNDNGIPHNFSLYTNSSATQALFVGQIITGGSITYHFTAPSAPGTYFFRCDVHPTRMTGSFIVQ